MRHYTLDILNRDGAVLLYDVYGAINHEPVFDGQLVVWLDQENCVLLDRDGNVRPIPSATRVERTGAP